MYDAPGADEGREWIEVTNVGNNPVDLGKFKLLESGTHHGLAVVSGGRTLAAGASAVIAADTKNFAVDYPSYSGILFDSAFALLNTGELLVIEDASTTPLDTVLYTAAVGADGEGGSLHKNGSSFASALPNPGIYPGELIAVPKAAVQEKAVPKTPTKKSASSAAPAKSPSQKTSAVSAYNSAQPAAPVHALAQPPVKIPAIPQLYLWILGCVAVILLGIAGVCLVLLGRQETPVTADEFKIQ